MSKSAHHDPTVPRGALIGAAAILIFTMTAAGAVKLGIFPHSANPEQSRIANKVAPAQTRELHFVDQPDGTVLISEARSGQSVKVIKFGEGGFLRATMRRMAKARAAAGIGAEPPFVLTRWKNGALSIKDPQTGREAEIVGFGPDHTKVFSDMLDTPLANDPPLVGKR